jgi:hypothetical protein
VNFDDEVRDILILCSFQESWNGLVIVVSKSVSVSNTLKFDDVIGFILREEMRPKITGENFSGGRSPHWVNHVYLCLYCIVYLLCFISTFVLFYCSTILVF